MENLSNEGLAELKAVIVDRIKKLEGEHIAELHHKLFNERYFISDYDKAKEWIENNYGVFEALNKIKEYETFNFGVVTTDLSVPVRVLDVLVQVLGEELLNDCEYISGNWDGYLDSEIAKEIKEFFSN